MLRLAGVRINPRTNGPHRGAALSRRITLKAIADGSGEEGDAAAIAGADVDRLLARRQALRVHAACATTASSCGSATRRPDRRSRSRRRSSTRARRAVLVGRRRRVAAVRVRRRRTAAPRRRRQSVPTGPNIQENRGVVGAGAHLCRTCSPARTTKRCSTTTRTSQLAYRRRRQRPAHAGRPSRDLRHGFSPSPDGNFVLVGRVKRPFSWLVPYSDFPTSVEIWDRKRGALVKTDRRRCRWPTMCRTAACCRARATVNGIPTAPATIVWAEALDGGNPKTKVPHPRQSDDAGRAVHRQRRPSSPRPSIASERRVDRSGASIWLTENDRDRAGAHLGHRQAGRDAAQAVRAQLRKIPTTIPGTPLRAVRGSGTDVVFQNGDNVFMTGVGVVAEGRPAVPRSVQPQDRRESERLFQTDGSHLRTGARRAVGRWLAIHHAGTRRGPRSAADRYVRGREANSRRPMTTLCRSGAGPLQGVEVRARHLQAQGRRAAVGHDLSRRRAGRRTRDRCRRCCGRTRASSPIPNMAGQVTGSPIRFTTPIWRHVAPAVPHAGLRHHRRSDDADRRTR